MENKFVFRSNTAAANIGKDQAESEFLSGIISKQQAKQQAILPLYTSGYQELELKNKEIDGHAVVSLCFRSDSADGAMYNIFSACTH